MTAGTLNWDDLRLVLAIADQGTLSGAASALRLSHPTLSRRLRRVEDELGTRLFDRTPRACVPTAAGEEMSTVARRVRQDIAELERRITGRDRDPAGLIRLTAPDAVAEYLLPSVIAAVYAHAPTLKFELDVSNEVLSLAQRASDMALRVTDRPDPGLRGRKLGRVAMAVYARRDLAIEDPQAASVPWVGVGDTLACSGPGVWIRAHVSPDAIRFRANTVLAAAQAVRAGVGCGVLPCFVGGSIRELVALSGPLEGLSTALWLLTHPEMSAVPRIRAASHELARHLESAGALLSGEAAASPAR